MRTLVSGSMGPSILVRGPLDAHRDVEGPAHSPALNDRWCPSLPGCQRGGRVSPVLGLGGHQSPVLRRQAPWEGPLGGQPRIRVSPQETSRPDPTAVRRAEWRTEVGALASSSMGPRVLARMAFKSHRSLEGPSHSPTLKDQRRPSGPMSMGQQGESGIMTRGSPIPGVVAAGPFRGAPLGPT